MLTWEYPPVSVGGLGNHVYCLSKHLGKSVDVDVVTVGNGTASETEQQGRVTVYRVNQLPVNALDFTTWVMQLNMALAEKSIELAKFRQYDIVHAHDWLVAYAARFLKGAQKLPLVATIHATEVGRNQGLHNDLQHYINSVEWWLTYEAWRVIVCSKHMYGEVQHQFQLPQDKLDIIPNGIDPAEFQLSGDSNRYQGPKVIFYVGRLVREKGVQILIEAMPRILDRQPNTRLIIAGKGPMREHLGNIVRQLAIEDKVDFVGFVDDRARNQYYHQASVAVFPSLYEPFGIVALEGMATKTPVVVSDTGGLGEIITHGVNGLKALPGNVDSLAVNILAALETKGLAQTLVNNASKLIREKYDWQAIANNTLDVYSRVLVDERSVTSQSNFTTVTPTEVPQAYQLRDSLLAQRIGIRREAD